MLAARGITYVPDFVANAGGVIHIHAGGVGWTADRLDAEIAGIGDRVPELRDTAASGGLSLLAAAQARAAERLGLHDGAPAAA